MIGDKYQVFYSEGGATLSNGEYDTWLEAKEARNSVFHANRAVRAAWVMRSNPSLSPRTEKCGFTLQRTKREASA